MKMIYPNEDNKTFCNRFASDLLHAFYDGKKNTVVSPWSVLSMLMLAADATAGATKDEVIRFTGGSRKLKSESENSDMFLSANAVCSNTQIKPAFRARHKDEIIRAEELGRWIQKQSAGIPMSNKIHEAIQFAVNHYEYAGVGFDGNYFLPPMEMLSILNGIDLARLNPDLMIAGILYHTVEDTDATIDMIIERFGEVVAGLVGEHLKYLYLGWEKGNQKLIEAIKDSSAGIKVLTLCDTVVKLRKLSRELRINGEETWGQQGVSKESLCIYFSKIQDELYDLQFDDLISPVYWEMVDRFKDIFVTFYYDRENQRMFQVSLDGEGYVIGKENLQAKPLDQVIPESAVLVNRKYAERIEDNWGEAYDKEQQTAGFRFEEYFVAVKNHLRGFLKDTSENDLDMLMIANMDYIKTHYDVDIARLLTGEMAEDIFRTESPARTADGLEKLAGAPDNN